MGTQRGRADHTGQTALGLAAIRRQTPPSYRLSAKVERKTGNDALIFPIVVGEKECNVCLDGWPRGGVKHSGLELIRGHGPPTNSTRHRGRLLHTNRLTSLHIDVTPTSVGLTVDRRQIFAWKGDPNVFSMQPGWVRPDKTVLGHGSYSASFQISELTLSTAGREETKIRAKQNAFVWELKDQTRIVLDSETNQELPVTAQGEALKIPLSQIQSLLQQNWQTRCSACNNATGEKDSLGDNRRGRFKIGDCLGNAQPTALSGEPHDPRCERRGHLEISESSQPRP